MSGDKKAIARRALGLLDLTSLNDGDTEQSIRDLCARADTKYGPTAAVCVWPRFAKLAADLLKDSPIQVAAVANFPHGDADVDQAVTTSSHIIADGADEVDVVFPYKAFLDGDTALAAQLVAASKKACGPNGRLKVILETGCLKAPDAIKSASLIALENGADFIKTSTGKTEVSATLDAARIMLECIRDTGSKAGFKPSGGIRDVNDAESYLALADEIMGPDWATAETFRFGASGLLNNLLAVLDGADDVAPSTEAY